MDRDDPHPSTPIAAPEFAALLAACLAPLAMTTGADPRLALAVSGGSDSMALLHLTAAWLWSQPVPPGEPDDRILVLTVDHGLRPESAAEAAFVAATARGLGVAHATLTWTGAKPRTGVPAAARAARYRLIAEHLAGEAVTGRSPRVLLTAHTADDQAETLLMRLARGSGLDGLAAMQPVTTLAIAEAGGGDTPCTLTIARPLLAVPKSRLVATLEAAGRDWREDPSNTDHRFERPQLRRTLTALAPHGIDGVALARSAGRLGRARLALEQATDTLVASVAQHRGAWAEIGLDDLLAAPAEIAIRLLGRLLASHGGQGGPPSLERVEALHARIVAAGHTGAPLVATLGGAVVEVAGGAHPLLRICREPGRGGRPRLVLRPGSIGLWDGRFRVAVGAALDGPIEVAGLDGTAWTALVRAYPTIAAACLPRRARQALPALWRQGILLAVPHLACDAPMLAGPALLLEPAALHREPLPAPPGSVNFTFVEHGRNAGND